MVELNTARVVRSLLNKRSLKTLTYRYTQKSFEILNVRMRNEFRQSLFKYDDNLRTSNFWELRSKMYRELYVSTFEVSYIEVFYTLTN